MQLYISGISHSVVMNLMSAKKLCCILYGKLNICVGLFLKQFETKLWLQKRNKRYEYDHSITKEVLLHTHSWVGWQRTKLYSEAKHVKMAKMMGENDLEHVNRVSNFQTNFKLKINAQKH